MLDPVLEGSASLFEELPDNICGSFDFVNGEDADELLRSADVVVRERFYSHRHSAVPMETRGLVAEVDPATGRLTVWGAAKVKHFNKHVLAGMLGLEPTEVRVLYDADNLYVGAQLYDREPE